MVEFTKIIKKYNPKIKAIARKLDGKYTSFNNDDLYQEAVVYLWDKHNKDELHDKTDSFILQGCFFNMRNYIRTMHKSLDRKAVSMNIPINEDGNTYEDLLADSNAETVSSDLVNRSLLRDVRGKLNERELRVLSYSYKGMTNREIGGEIGVSHVMVGKIMKKIRTKCEVLR